MKKTKKQPASIRQALSLACCSLLQSPLSAQAELLDNIEVDSAVLIYQEANGRVSVIEPVVKLKKDINEDEQLSLQLVFDSLTGASPNGAQASNITQTFTSPSGNKSYTTPAGSTPLDDTFKDTRVAANLNYQSKSDRVTTNTFSGNFSREYDWTSIGADYTYSKDVNQRNTTLSIGTAISLDLIDPVGGAPIAFAEMAAVGSPQPKESDESRNTFDLMLGISQVINKKTISQLNLGFSQSNGYHTDPYKLLSVIDSTTGQPNGSYLFENRPDSRLRQTLYWKTAHHLNEDVVHITYRYYQDDWGINSHTIDLKYRYRLSAKDYLQPHLRYYTQTAADFYRHSLLDSEVSSLPDYASADYRLAEFNTITYGLKYGYLMDTEHELSGRIEFIQQTGDSSPSDAIGEQQNQDLYPQLNAFVLQLSYSFSW